MSNTSDWSDIGTPDWVGQVRFNDLDAMGMVNYSVFLNFLDEALLNWWQGMPLPFQPVPSDLGLITAGMSCAWLKPLCQRSNVEVYLGVSEVRKSSFIILSVVRATGEQEPCFVAEVVQVYWRSGKPVTISPELRDAILARLWKADYVSRCHFALRRDSGTTIPIHD